MTTSQAQAGVTLQSLNNTSTSNSTQGTEVQNDVNNAIATNFPAALTSLDQNTTAVEYHQLVAQVQNLSLFSIYPNA